MHPESGWLVSRVVLLSLQVPTVLVSKRLSGLFTLLAPGHLFLWPWALSPFYPPDRPPFELAQEVLVITCSPQKGQVCSFPSAAALYPFGL